MTGATAFDIAIFALAILSIIVSALLGQAGILRRSLAMVAVLFGATLIVTGMLRLVPGNPVDHILGDQAPKEARMMLAKELRLVDDNGNPVGFVAQYGRFIKGIAKNELTSFRNKQPVFKIIKERIPYTAKLAFFAMVIAILIGLPLGVAAAAGRGTFIDTLLMFFALVGISIPRFWLGPILLLVFSIRFGLFPVSGVDEGLTSYVLPCISLGTALAAVLARMTRGSVLEVMSEDYIRSARAKGLSERIVFMKHALRNALIPVITLIGLQFAALLGGAVVTEKVFNLPGIGLLLLESIQKLDMPVVQGVIFTIAAVYVLVNLLTDLAYELVDPRIRIASIKE